MPIRQLLLSVTTVTMVTIAIAPTTSTRFVREEAASDVETIDPSFVQDFVRLTRLPGQGGGGGFGR